MNRIVDFFLVILLTSIINATPLDDYVNKPDPSYSYFDTGLRIDFPYAKGYIINMTSQTWLSHGDVDRSIWWHSLVVIVPNNLVDKNNGFLWITGLSNKDDYPVDGSNKDLVLCSTIASSTGSIAAALFQIPNQPIIFTSDPQHRSRSEDSIIAYTWAKYINDSSLVEWPLRLPMAKAAVRAMDTVQTYSKFFNASISNWIVGGESKRGWTTWLVGAVDKRVKAIVPVVMDLLNIQPNLHHMYRILGGWTYAFQDYYINNLTSNIDSTGFSKLTEIVDPYSYKERLTMPKLIIDGSDDEFFALDDNYYWWNEMGGENLLFMAKNASHNLQTAWPQIVNTIVTFASAIIKDEPRPLFNWNMKYNSTNGVIEVHVAQDSIKPTNVFLIYANSFSKSRRDFRWAMLPTKGKCPQGTSPVGSLCAQPILWNSRNIQPTSDNVYQASIDFPSEGWIASFLELHFKNSESMEFILTTQVMVLPNTYPFPPCQGTGCKGVLL